MRRCWSSRRCLFRLSTGQVLERGRGLISDVECVCARARCRTRIGESAYFRVYIPPIQEFITLDSTLTEIYRIRNRLEGRREYQAFRFGGSSSSRTTWISRSTRSQHHRPVVGRLRHYSPSLSICLSLSFLSEATRGKTKASFHRGRASIDGKIGRGRVFSGVTLLIYFHFVE